MTYRTVLTLNPDHPATRNFRADFHAAHQMIMSGFAHLLPDSDFITGADGTHPDQRANLRILHAVQTRPGGTVQVLVQSDQPGHWNQQGWSDALTTEPRTSQPTLITDGTVRYQLAYNPVYNQSRTGRKLPLRTNADILAWWTKRAADRGLELTAEPTLIRTETLRSAKKHRSLTTAVIQGSATVTNPDQLTTAITDGVGRSRAYGCGLLLTQQA